MAAAPNMTDSWRNLIDITSRYRVRENSCVLTPDLVNGKPSAFPAATIARTACTTSRSFAKGGGRFCPKFAKGILR
jgi:hypothetical protein